VATPNAGQLNEIVAQLSPLFKNRGFRKRRFAFNRKADERTTHVVQFQLGPSWSSVHGRFRVNVALHLGELDPEAPAFLTESACQVRRTLGSLARGTDEWLSLDASTDSTARAVAEDLVATGFPWLDRFTDRTAFLRAWHAGADEARPFVGLWTVALLHHQRGEQGAAGELIRNELRTTQHRGRAQQLVQDARALGYDVSIAEATIANMLDKERRDSRVK
jgi:hypothetical protein